MASGKIIAIGGVLAVIIALGIVFGMSSENIPQTETAEINATIEEKQGTNHSVTLSESLAVSSNP